VKIAYLIKYTYYSKGKLHTEFANCIFPTRPEANTQLTQQKSDMGWTSAKIVRLAVDDTIS
jgi:hypothetical protein